jgi:hypothetical protein
MCLDHNQIDLLLLLYTFFLVYYCFWAVELMELWWPSSAVVECCETLVAMKNVFQCHLTVQINMSGWTYSCEERSGRVGLQRSPVVR